MSEVPGIAFEVDCEVSVEAIMDGLARLDGCKVKSVLLTQEQWQVLVPSAGRAPGVFVFEPTERQLCIVGPTGNHVPLVERK